MGRTSANAETGWEEEGYAVFYSYADLLDAGKLSGDKLKPWSRIEDGVMNVARQFKQVCIYRWHPHTFGHYDETKDPGGGANAHRAKRTQIVCSRLGRGAELQTHLTHSRGDSQRVDQERSLDSLHGQLNVLLCLPFSSMAAAYVIQKCQFPIFTFF